MSAADFSRGWKISEFGLRCFHQYKASWIFVRLIIPLSSAMILQADTKSKLLVLSMQPTPPSFHVQLILLSW